KLWEEKPSGNSVDPNWLPESQMVIVPKVTLTEPTRPDQHGSTEVDYVPITPDKTLSLEVHLITDADDPISSPHITTIITTKLTTSKQKKHDPPKSCEGEKRYKQSRFASKSSSRNDQAMLDVNYTWVTRSSDEDKLNEVVETYQDPNEPEDTEIEVWLWLFGNKFMSKVEYDYNMDRMRIAMSNDMDWALDHGLGFDSKQPLSLKIKYALSITKCHATEYKYGWIEEDIGRLFRRTLVVYDMDSMLGIHHCEMMKRLTYRGKKATTTARYVYSNLTITFVDEVKVDVLYEYGFLESITMTRADKKKYTFKESNFS
ncbi:hypothetical protein Tco_1476996, partial [Tanacetum coccineum]